MAATCSEKQNKIKTKKSDRACALECCSDTFWLVISELIAKRSHFFHANLQDPKIVSVQMKNFI